jgi:hypothetical protein
VLLKKFETDRPMLDELDHVHKVESHYSDINYDNLSVREHSVLKYNMRGAKQELTQC